MPGNIPNPVWLYRIVHIDNVEHILRNGMFTHNHPNADPDYINIGDISIIEQRDKRAVRINPPGGILGEYIPFYFGFLSPMLLNIKTGYRGITQRPQSDVVYICCKLEDIIANCREWFYTDGHVIPSITLYFNNLADLDKIDWDIVFERYWRDNEDDYDRKRRKQAEFLVKTHVPVECIGEIVVYDDNSRRIIETLKNRLRLHLPIKINQDYYYYDNI